MRAHITRSLAAGPKAGPARAGSAGLKRHGGTSSATLTRGATQGAPPLDFGYGDLIAASRPAGAANEGGRLGGEGRQGHDKAAREEGEGELTIHAKGAPSVGAEARPEVSAALGGAARGGETLPSELRSHFGLRLGHDFSRVRVHADAPAAAAAEALSARAFTAGRDIFFAAGQYAPETPRGRGLLAHELTHVAQQAAGQPAGRIQAKPDDKKPAAGPKVTHFKIVVHRDMDAEELRREFVKQYYAYTTEAQVQTKLPLWVNTSQRGTLPADVARGFVVAKVTSEYQTDFDTLDPKEKEAVNAETDRRFWESTGYKPGEKLGGSAKDQEMAVAWKGVRNAVLTEDKLRKELEALPDDIKAIVFADGPGAAAASPADYARLLAIAHKLAGLPPEARKDYLGRVNASTASLSELEASIDAYLRLRAEREKQAADKEAAAKPLLGAEGLYDLYKAYKLAGAALSAVARSRGGGGLVQGRIEGVTRAESALLAALRPKNFDSIAAFEAAMEAYRVAFRTQAVNLALDVLARYDHMLFEEKKKLRQGAAAAIAQGVAGTKAKELYKDASHKSLLAVGVSMAPEGANAELAQDLRKESKQSHAQAEAEVVRGSGNDPLVAERGVDREKIAGLDAGGVQKYLDQTIEERADHVRKARLELAQDPDRVFHLTDLIAATRELQRVDPDTIYGKIITDYIDRERQAHLLSSIAVGIVAVALAFLVPVGGWVAAAALVTGAVISLHQAYEAYAEYKQQVRGYELHFLSDEPSLFWVGLAVAAAALDLGLATGVVLKESAAALKALKGPMLEFSKDGELAKIVATIEAADLNKALKLRLEQEARASLESAKGAWKSIRSASSSLNMVIGPFDPTFAREFFRALYSLVRAGVKTVEGLAANAKFAGAIGDLGRMTGAKRAELEAAFDEVKQLVKVGEAKAMDDASLLNYVDRWALNQGKPGFQSKLLNDMEAWKPPTAEQRRALEELNAQKRVVSGLHQRKTAAQEELAEHLSKPPAERSAEDVAEIRKLQDELSRLDPVAYPPKRRLGPGQIAEAEGKLADKEQGVIKSQASLYDRIRSASPSVDARARTLRGATADQVGPLKTPPSPPPLEAEHIVSVREISEMEGFAELPWKEQKAVADLKENLIAMDGAANKSKLARTWRAWPQASNFYDASTIEAMIRREDEARAFLQAEIKRRLPKPPGAKP